MKFSAILLLAVFISINAFSQPDIKGYKVGTKLDYNYKTISLVGYEYRLSSYDISYKGKDYTYWLEAGAYEKNKEGYYDCRNSTETEINNLISAVETKYQIKLKYELECQGGCRTWTALKDGYFYEIKFPTSSINGSFVIFNYELQQKIYDAQKRDKANKNKSLQNDI